MSVQLSEGPLKEKLWAQPVVFYRETISVIIINYCTESTEEISITAARHNCYCCYVTESHPQRQTPPLFHAPRLLKQMHKVPFSVNMRWTMQHAKPCCETVTAWLGLDTKTTWKRSLMVMAHGFSLGLIETLVSWVKVFDWSIRLPLFVDSPCSECLILMGLQWN